MGKGRSIVRVLVDSTVLFSAVNSPIGGSAKMFSLEQVELLVSRIVLHEVEKNVRAKLQYYHLDRFFMLASKMTLLENIPFDKQIVEAKKVITEKDAVILAEVKNANCEYLITLDKKDFLQEKVAEFIKPKKILTPKMFFEI